MTQMSTWVCAVFYFLERNMRTPWQPGSRARCWYGQGPGFARWQGESAGVRLVHGAQNALRQGGRLLFMGQVAQAGKTAYERFRLSHE